MNSSCFILLIYILAVKLPFHGGGFLLHQCLKTKHVVFKIIKRYYCCLSAVSFAVKLCLWLIFLTLCGHLHLLIRGISPASFSPHPQNLYFCLFGEIVRLPCCLLPRCCCSIRLSKALIEIYFFFTCGISVFSILLL